MKKKNLLTILLILLVIFSMLFTIACQPPEGDDVGDDDDDTQETNTQLITNGTFASGTNSGSANTYLKDTVNGWTKTNAASYYSNAVMGVIDLTQDKFAANNAALYENGLDYPGIAPSTPKDGDGKYTDTNALIIGLPDSKGSVYYKTTSSIKVVKGKYYRLSIDVYTDIFQTENELQGAYLIINNQVFAEFIGINKKEWQTFEVYIEASNFEDRTFYVELWLGHGPRYIGTQTEENLNPRITKGFAIFDNVILKEVESAAYNTQFAELGGEGIVGRKAVVSLLYPDKGFTYETKYSFISPSSTTSKSYYSARSGAANNYTMTVGTEDAATKSDFPSYDGSSATAGIFDLSKLYNYTAANGDTPAKYTDAYNLIANAFHAPAAAKFYTDGVFGLKGNRSSENLRETEALLIYHPNYALSGLGYKSNQTYLVEKDKYYTISVWAYVWVPEYGVEEPDEPAEPTTGERDMPEPDPDDYTGGETSTEYQTALNTYNANKTAWLKYDEDYEKWEDEFEKWQVNKDKYELTASRVSAEFRLTGASIEKGTLVKATEPGVKDEWQLLTFYVRGNELSDRNVNFEFWFGEGEWASDTLMVGGAIFDNISIDVRETPVPGETYDTLSPLTVDDYQQFGLDGATSEEYTPITDDSGIWDFSFEDEKSDADNAQAGIVQGDAAKTEAKWANIFPNLPMPKTLSITKDGVVSPFNLLMLYNKEYTATSLVYNPDDGDRVYIEINPNSFYRLSIWVRTDNIDSGLGLDVTLYDDKDASLSSLTAINTEGGWQELTFLVRGSSIKKNNAYITFKLGSGNVYTPAKHVRGVAYMTAITWKSISYTEFNSASTGKYVAKKSISDTPSTSNSITNGYFAELDTSNFSEKGDEKIFDDNGNLIGVAKPTSWTLSSPVNALSTPKNLSVTADGYLTWDAVERAEQYYIYMDGVKVDAEGGGTTTKNNILIHKTNATETEECKYKIEYFLTGSFKIRAVRHTPDADGAIGVSAYSSTVTNTHTEGNKNYDESLVDLKSEFGIIDYKNYAKLKEKTGLSDAEEDWRQDFYYKEGVTGLQYISTKSNHLLMLSSDFYTRGGFTASSTSLSSNTYYIMSVWVKTIGDARASVTINNTSKVFARTEYPGENYETEGDYVGYVNINTGGDWQQFRFYIQTTVSSATLQLELFLGNKYAVGKKIYEEDGDLKETVTKGLSKGTVFFDDISFVTISDEEEFNKLAFGGDPEEIEEGDRLQENTFYNLKDLENNYLENKYKFKLLDYTTDSFDIFTPASDEDSVNGGSAKDYTHYLATGAVDYSSGSEQQAMLYGVYDGRKTTRDSKVVEALMNSDTLNSDDWMGDVDEDDFAAFLKTGANMGNNFLMMANLKDNGQYYLSGTGISLTPTTYYKITFFAKTWIPAGKYGEFRFEYGNQTGKYSTIRITNQGKGEGMQQYTFYVYNSSTDTISGSKISFYLGSNSETATDATPTNFFRGLMIIDNISVEKLDAATEYEDAVESYDSLTSDEKLNASFNTYKFVKEETTGDNGDDGDEDEGGKEKINSQLWLLVASIVIGAVLIAVVVVLSWRRIKKRVKRNIPVKVISNVPVNLSAAEQKKAKTASKKKEIKGDDDFTD